MPSPAIPPPSESRGPLPWLWGGILLAGLCTLVAAYFLWPDRKGNPPDGAGGGAAPPPSSAAECLQWLHQKNVALALLENNKFVEAAAPLLELTNQLPEEELGPRNLTIARLMAADQKAIEVDQAAAALEILLRRAPDSYVSHVLAGRVAAVRANQHPEEADAARQLALSELQQAAKLAPREAFIHYEIYTEAQNASEPAVRRQARTALQAAYQLEPQNLFVLLDWLLEQVQAKDETIAATLSAAREALQPNAAGIKQRTRVDPLDLLDAALAAVKTGDWGAATNRLRILSNVVRPLPDAQSDRRRVKRNSLEFVLQEFSSRFCPGVELQPSESNPPIDIKFAAFSQQAAFPAIQGVRELKLTDFDLDGRLDVVLLREAIFEVYGRPDPEGEWKRIAHSEIPAGMEHILTADLDADIVDAAAQDPQPAQPADQKPRATAAGRTSPCFDADPDFILYGAGGGLVLRNDLDQASATRTLTPVTQDEDFQKLSGVTGGVLADVDHDGDLDVVLCAANGTSIWSSRGNMTFQNVSARSQLPPPELKGTALVAVDWDHDVDLDILIASPGGEPSGYLENLQHGQLRWRPFPAEFAALNRANSLGLLDVGAHVSWDLLAGGPEGLRLAITAPPVSGAVPFVRSVSLSQAPVQGLDTWDYDNDGALDVVAWGAQGLLIFRGNGQGEFTPAPEIVNTALSDVAGCDHGDFDHDGDLDLAILDQGKVVLLSNEGGNANRWLDIRIHAAQIKGTGESSPSDRVNYYGIGSLLEMRAGALYVPQVVRRQTTHFGLGRRAAADVVRIVWTNGVPQTIVQPQPDQVLCERQILYTSCPFVYTWTGERYEFFTDLLWNAPLGLQLAEGVLAQPRAWEYLKIPGERLVPKDGRYALQVTSELWEADYLDQIELIAVDHPEGTEIYSNEKVGPPELAEFQVHTVRNPRPPVAARDQEGRDLWNTVAQEDGEFTKSYTQKLAQGLTTEHYLELDLGPLEDARKITLFLTGWMYPGDASLNVAFSQNPGLPRMRPPALWVPDAAGEWREVRPFMGFPGGKTKTIAVDLSGLFASGNSRLRIVTNMEFYWDHAFFTADEEPVEVQLTPLALASADLHFRGRSRQYWVPGNGPDRFDYQSVTPTPGWPAMEGRFTRYGPVAELLQDVDDHMAVIGSGDEITLEFALPDKPLPPGWKRDFLLHNTGWDKDANLNTISGQTVEPLPFNSMSGYPYTGEESYPDTPRHRAYLKKYQTRTQNPMLFWRELLER